MNRFTGILIAGLAISRAAHAQEWQTYTYPNPGFAIQFPGVPDVQTSKFKNAVGVTLPVTQYVVRQDRVQYTLSVVNYSSTNADALRIIGDAARSFSAKGKVNSDTGARVNGSWGRQLTVTDKDGSRSDIAIFFVDNHLYTAVGQALPPTTDTARFQQSLQFLVDDFSLRSLFGAAGKAASNTAASTAIAGGSTSNGGSAGSGNADAACAGKSAGDVVQLATPSGPIPATCTLTARPNLPAPPN
jgi:hypothetical protein